MKTIIARGTAYLTLLSVSAGVGYSQQSEALSTGVMSRPGAGLYTLELTLDATPLEPFRTVLRTTPEDGGPPLVASDGVLWRGPWIATSTIGELSFAERDNGSWAAITAVDSGGLHQLRFWRADSSGVGFESIDEVVLDGHQNLNGDVPARLFDLPSPELFTRAGRLHVFGAGLGDARRFLDGNEMVWIAEMPPPGAIATRGAHSLHGSVVGDGLDPRVLDLGAEVLVSMRQAKSLAERRGVAPVAFYRSTDLVTWTLDDELSQGVLASGGYDVAIDRGKLWLATPMPASGGRGARLSLSAFDTRTSTWRNASQIDPERHPLPSLSGRTWLFPHDAKQAGVLEVIYANTDGQLERRRL